MAEIIHNWLQEQKHDSELSGTNGGAEIPAVREPLVLLSTLRALGYVDILRVPTTVVEKFVLPTLSKEELAQYGQLDLKFSDIDSL